MRVSHFLRSTRRHASIAGDHAKMYRSARRDAWPSSTSATYPPLVTVTTQSEPSSGSLHSTTLWKAESRAVTSMLLSSTSLALRG
ncbi:hypothetical protein BV25DRAFT_300044 [Artomyces pyxidatus]|uniref:Uncharacterized protein n=1 Tax=Artomyces pyxidatus TaxID=48021 RepID=A0ACB8T5Y9_9AGAM|nr:hypothetical protein BV25DRAFT_300044 [Artomyces pyxidatus]